MDEDEYETTLCAAPVPLAPTTLVVFMAKASKGVLWARLEDAGNLESSLVTVDELYALAVVAETEVVELLVISIGRDDGDVPDNATVVEFVSAVLVTKLVAFVEMAVDTLSLLIIVAEAKIIGAETTAL